jgi:hypothetical protein
MVSGLGALYRRSLMKTSSSLLAVVVACLAVFPGLVLADVYSDLGAIHNPGYSPAGVPGQVISGMDATGRMLNPLVDYSYTTPAWNPPLAGDALDYDWVHESNSGPTSPANGTVWQFGIRATDYLLAPSIDHDPLPYEGIEATLWGSNDGGSTWTKGTLVEVYDLGMTTAVTENYSSRWVFNYPVDFVAATAGLAQNNYYYYDGDVEIDTVRAVPEPATAVLALLGMLFVRRSR